MTGRPPEEQHLNCGKGGCPDSFETAEDLAPDRGNNPSEKWKKNTQESVQNKQKEQARKTPDCIALIIVYGRKAGKWRACFLKDKEKDMPSEKKKEVLPPEAFVRKGRGGGKAGKKPEDSCAEEGPESGIL